MFRNEAKRRAKKQPVNEWLLWSYAVRMESNEAALLTLEAEQAGIHPRDIAMKLHTAAWAGTAREAGSYYPRAQVATAFDDSELEKRAAEILSRSQVNAMLEPMFTSAVIDHVKRMIDRSDDPEEQRRMEIERLQNNYAYINATPAPLLAEMEQLGEIREELERLDAAPDPELNARIKRELGIADTPFNTY